MANEQNLKPFTSDQSREKAVENGQKATEYLYSNMPIQCEKVDIDSEDLPF